MTSISLNRLWLLALALVAASAPAGDLLRHDLFARPSRTTLPMASESQAVWSPTLTAVVVAGDGSMATVGGTIVKIGEEINGYRLLRVQEEAAVFIKSGQQVVLTMNTTAVPASGLRRGR